MSLPYSGDLGKAPDAAIHPVSGRPVPARPEPAAADGAADTPEDSLAPTEEPAAAPSGKKFRRRGATSDSLLGIGATAPKVKLVDLEVRVPKGVRKRLRREAKARGMTPDQIVTLILDAALD